MRETGTDHPEQRGPCGVRVASVRRVCACLATVLAATVLALTSAAPAGAGTRQPVRAGAGNRPGAVAERPRALSAGTIWGVDSASTITPGFLAQISSTYGQPGFFGRYASTLTSAEVNLAASRGFAILVLDDANGTDDELGYAKGESDAKSAIGSAEALGVPAGTAIFRDVEANASSINVAYVEGYSDAMLASGRYEPGFYENPTTGSFKGAFCGAVAANANYKSDYLDSSEPEPNYPHGRTGPGAAPSWHPATPGCGGQTVVWQYAEPGKTGGLNLDTDEAIASGPLWEPAPEIAFQANTSDLWTAGVAGGSQGFGMMKATSPAITEIGGRYEIAFQANTGSLWTAGVAGTKDWSLPMARATSPSVTTLGGSFEVAYQGSDGDLWTAGADGTKDWGLAMAAGTSPAIAAIGSSFEVAFQASSGGLSTAGTAGSKDWNLGMKAATSPAIAAVGSGYEIAFQANTGSLFTVGVENKDWNLGMMAATSPAITAVGSSFEAAFQANTGALYTAGVDDRAWGLGMMKGTSPAIGNDGGAFEVAFQANTGSLYSVGIENKDWNLGMMAGTNPSVAG
jgi:hypothetical protein